MKILLLMFGLWLAFGSHLGWAKPEHLEIQKKDRKVQKNDAKALAKTVDLSKIEDPAAKAAFEAIFSTLNLKAKNSKN